MDVSVTKVAGPRSISLRVRIPLSLFTLAAILGVAACTRHASDAAAATSSQTARVDTLFTEWNRSDSPGCAVGISRNGTVVYEHGYGMADLEHTVAITPDTVFAVASITKAFTSMSVLLAAERGRLSLDDEVQKHIPDWQDRDDRITLRHLLTHTSGIRDGFGLLGWADPNESAGDVNEALLRMLARQRGGNFPPGSEYQYNNGGYNLLASILKRATGQSLRRFAEGTIFKPLGMAHTQIVDEASMVVPNRARGYTWDANGVSAARDQGGGVVGNDGMYSTVRDLLRWEDNFGNPRVGSPETLTLMQTPTVLANGSTTAGGMGLGIATYRGLPSIEGSGGSWGVASKFARFPNQRLSIAVLCNEDNIVMGGRARVNPDVFTNGIADIFLADAVNGRPEDGPHDGAPTSPAMTPTTAVPPPAGVKPSAEDLSEKTGLYRIGGTEYPALLSIDHETLMVRSYYGDDFDFELTPAGENRFMLRFSVPFEFIPAGPGRPKSWRVGEGKDERVWQSVDYPVPPAALRSYAGNFRSEELGVTYTLEPHQTGLTVKARGRGDVTVTPFSKDVFVGDWVGIVRFARDARGATSGFTVNRVNARGVRFDRVSQPADTSKRPR
jgi:CubicO group peptidase (beta-lactamase class C family)